MTSQTGHQPRFCARRLAAVGICILGAVACDGSTDPGGVSITVVPSAVLAVRDTVMGGQGTRFTVDVTITNRGSRSVFRAIDCAHSLEHLEGETWVQPDTWGGCSAEAVLHVPQEIPAGTAVHLHEELFTRDTALVGYTLTTSMIPGKFRMRYYLANSHNAPFPPWAGRSQEFTVTR